MTPARSPCFQNIHLPDPQTSLHPLDSSKSPASSSTFMSFLARSLGSKKRKEKKVQLEVQKEKERVVAFEKEQTNAPRWSQSSQGHPGSQMTYGGLGRDQWNHGNHGNHGNQGKQVPRPSHRRTPSVPIVPPRTSSTRRPSTAPQQGERPPFLQRHTAHPVLNPNLRDTPKVPPTPTLPTRYAKVPPTPTLPATYINVLPSPAPPTAYVNVPPSPRQSPAKANGIAAWAHNVASSSRNNFIDVDSDSEDDLDFLSACSSLRTSVPSRGPGEEDEAASDARRVKLFVAVMRVVEGERGYYEDLCALSEVYFKNLGRSGMLNHDQLWVVTRNIEELVLFQSRLVDSLLLIRTRLDNTWNDFDSRERELSNAVSLISKLFISQEMNFQVYRDFCAMHFASSSILRSLEGTSNWMQFEISCGKQIRMHFPQSSLASLRLEDYAIKPVQKICRYGLVFDQLLKYSSPRDLPLISQATETMRRVAMKVNVGMASPVPPNVNIMDGREKEEKGGSSPSRWPSRRTLKVSQNSSAAPPMPSPSALNKRFSFKGMTPLSTPNSLKPSPPLPTLPARPSTGIRANTTSTFLPLGEPTKQKTKIGFGRRPRTAG
ncbi:Dbl homology domain-containing protein [Atractiella rhizophila]|nr:Dbl homology domain-containing protein [Atractiella rhizophila]